MTCTAIDGRLMAVTGSPSETVQVWDLATGALRAKEVVIGTGWGLTVIDRRAHVPQ